jgi:hypothetical protein
MITAKLRPDSRGVVMSFILISKTVVLILQGMVTIRVQASFDTDDGETDYVRGGYKNVSLTAITQGLLIVAAMAW